jgi:hypothetical protein
MLLKIRGIAANRHHVELYFEAGPVRRTFTSKYFPSPLSAGLRKLFAAYFAAAQPDVVQAERLIRIGQAMGEGVHGEGLELSACREIIERNGYGQLQVVIEADHPGFFAEHWEALILPESKYVLSAHCAGFTRRFVDDTHPAAGPEGRTRAGPMLRIAHLVGRDDDSSEVCALATAFAAQDFAAPTRIDVLDPRDEHELDDWLRKAGSELTALHFDGPVRLGDGQAFVRLGIGPKGTEIPLRALAERLRAHGIPVLSLDVRVGRGDVAEDAAGLLLAQLAREARAVADVDVIGLAYRTNPWDAARCFRAIFGTLAKGLPASLAVVEARKALQADAGTCALCDVPVEFHAWSLPVHYGPGDARFRSTAEAPPSLLPGISLAAANRQKLFGFHSRHFEPMTTHLWDGGTIALLRPASAGAIHLIHGARGTGKSHLVHQVALQACATGLTAFAFRFDLAVDGDLTPEDMCQMIAPMLAAAAQGEPGTGESPEAMPRCCFVLDLARKTTDAPALSAALAEHLVSLGRQGHLVILAAGDTDVDLPGALRHEVVPPTAAAQRALFCTRYRQRLKADATPDALDLAVPLAAARGNAYLLERLASLAAAGGKARLEAACRDLQAAETPSPEVYLRLRWHAVDPAVQRLLIAMRRFPSVLWEMLSIVTDRFDPAGDVRALPCAARFFPSPSCSNLKLAAALDDLEASGFLERTVNGRVTAVHALDFLASNERSTADDAECFHDDAQALHEVIAESLRLLVPQLRAKPNPVLLNHLVGQRAQWARCLEALWRDQAFDTYFGAKAELDWLLAQAGLSAEGQAWAAALLAGTDDAMVRGGDAPALAWLALASMALGTTDQAPGSADGALARGVDYFAGWVDRQLQLASIPDADRPLLGQAAAFVEVMHLRAGRWAEGERLSERLLDLYSQWNNVPLRLRCLRNLARCAHERGAHGEAERWEGGLLQLLTDPAGEVPDKVQARAMLDLLASRHARQDAPGSRSLLDRMSPLFDRLGWSRMLDPYRTAPPCPAGAPTAASSLST